MKIYKSIIVITWMTALFLILLMNKNSVAVSAVDISSDSILLAQEPIDTDLPVMPEISKDEFNRQMNSLYGSENQYAEDIEPERGTFPAKYDPRTLGMVSHVSNQGNYGLCWVYAAISTAESSLIKQGFANSSIDLSELHALYFYRIDLRDSGTHVAELSAYCNGGGDEVNIIRNMRKGIGPVLESTVPWRNITDDIVLDDSLYHSHVQELYDTYSAQIESDSASRDKIKSLISTYGGVSAGMYLYTNYFKYANTSSDDTTYNYPYNCNAENHAIEIVGWDDDYPASNFIKAPSANGAWLIKNSYGTESEKSGMGTGYLWISYYDKTVNGTTAIALQFAQAGSTPYTLKLDKTEATMEVGTSFTLNAEVLPATAKDKNVKWVSSREDVAAVDSNGKITATKNGEAVITGYTNAGSAKNTCTVTVITKASEMTTRVGSNDTAEGTLVVGKTESIYFNISPSTTTNREFSYKVSDSSIIDVKRKSGIINSLEVTALKPGTATITATTTDGTNISKTITIHVVEEEYVKSISTVGISNTLTLPVSYFREYYTVKLKLVGAKANEWYSVEESNTNSAVAYCTSSNIKPDANGNAEMNLFIQGVGETTITLTVQDKIKPAVSFKVVVTDTQPSIAPSPSQTVYPSTSPSQTPSIAPSTPLIPLGTKIASLSKKGTSVTVKWKAYKSKVDGYQIAYSTSSSFKSYKAKTIRKAATSKTTIKNLKKKKTYYFRIRTFKKYGNKTTYSKWSGKKKVKIA